MKCREEAGKAAQPMPGAITTTGDNSPGFVGGNYTVTQTIVRQYEEAKRKTWRGLRETVFPLLAESQSSKARLWNILAVAAAETFRERRFVRFTFIVHKEVRAIGDETIPIYTLLTSQSGFSATAHSLYSELMRELIESQKSGNAERVQNQIEERLRSQHSQISDWSRSISVAISNEWNAVQCTCDSEAKACEFLSITDFSLDPADYHEHVTTTSEMLQYVVSAFNTQLGFTGDTGWYQANYPLMKLWINLADHNGVNFSNIKVNAEDPEEWDYLNGAFDAEIRRFAAGGGQP